MAVTIPNTTRIRTAVDSTIVDALQQTVNYINKNVTPIPGNRVPPPARGSRPVHPTP